MLEESDPASTTPDRDGQLQDPAPAPSRRERFRAAVAHRKSQSTELLKGLERIRPDSRTVSAGFHIFERDREFPTGLMVGALAARLVIFLIPFLFLVVFTIALGSDLVTSTAAEVAREAGLPSMFAQAAQDSSAASGELQLAGFLLTALAVMWAANGLGQTMRLATSVVWRTSRQRAQRRWLVPLTVIGFTVLVMAVNTVGHQMRVPGVADDIARLIFKLASFGGLWLVASRFLPHHPDADRWRYFAPGALLAAIAVVAMDAVLIFYLAPKWNTLGERYGDIGIVLVMLSFAYLVGLAVVASAHVNSATFYTRRDPSQLAPNERSWPLLDLLRNRRKPSNIDRAK